MYQNVLLYLYQIVENISMLSAESFMPSLYYDEFDPIMLCFIMFSIFQLYIFIIFLLISSQARHDRLHHARV